VIQPKDVTDMHYRTVSGDSDVLKEQLEEIALPYKKLCEVHPDEKARLSRTSSVMLPAKWSVGEGRFRHSPPTAERMYENGCTIFRGCTRMYEFLVV
jgi:hypothetical protein